MELHHLMVPPAASDYIPHVFQEEIGYLSIVMRDFPVNIFVKANLLSRGKSHQILSADSLWIEKYL